MERFLSLLEHGFWMTIPPERLAGLTDGTRPRWVAYQAPMTCFTELRLTAAKAHYARYGLLGIVVDRKFVLERWGAPVHYVRSNADDVIVGNAAMLLAWIQKQKDNGTQDADAVMVNLKFLVGFMKGMSDPDTENFLYLEEQEWRVVHSYGQQERGRILPTSTDTPRYLLPFSRSDVQMLVVPDSKFREEMHKSEKLAAWIGKPHIPVLTCEEIGQF